ncbi:MAG: type VI secretion system tip protein VgrG [Burkholderiaceae bacterium]|jgi:type VI secretion system secreted protein VgrG|nr:type VI secretion system tip protein VgrG [Burkholderiaceae bacterium]
MSRTFIAHSALGDELQFRAMSGDEKISTLFEFRVDLLSQTQGISAKDMLGTDFTVEADLTTEEDGPGTRYLSGMVTGFNFTGRNGDFYAYRAIVRPWLWLATRRVDHKIFQNKTVPEIVQEVLSRYGFTVENRLCRSYRKWDFCVQYGESDFNFVNRLLFHEGAYFYFQHRLGAHDLVLGDDIGSLWPLPNGPTTIPYYPSTRAAHIHGQDFIDTWSGIEDITSGKYLANDYDFTRPRAKLNTEKDFSGGYNQSNWDVFNWPGGYTQVNDDGLNYADARIEQITVHQQTITGSGIVRNIAPGYLFNLENYPDKSYNQQYIIESAHYAFTENIERSDGGGTDTSTTYRITFTAVPLSVSYRATPYVEKPRTHGPQTAVVVGPPGEEIWTDIYGRVKVQFFWDRYGKMDQNSSCWIRVSQTWAGGNYGTMHVPRIGQEVIVDFLNGDPDYPIITGRVYNAMQMPPWDLPANKTQSGIKTRSTQNGTPGDGFKNTPGTTNVIRFEDRKDHEQLWFHAQKDQLTEVENQEDKWVGADRNKTIDGNETNVIHKNRTETVDLDETITVHQNRTETVDWNEQVTIHQNQQHTVDINRKRNVGVNETVDIGSNQHLTVGSNRVKTVGLTETDTIGILQTETVGLANLDTVGLVRMSNVGILYDLNVGLMMKTLVGQTKSTNVGSEYSVTVGGKQGSSNITMTPTSIVLQVGKSKIVLNADGSIALNGQNIDIVGDEHIGVDSKRIDHN